MYIYIMRYISLSICFCQLRYIIPVRLLYIAQPIMGFISRRAKFLEEANDSKQLPVSLCLVGGWQKKYSPSTVVLIDIAIFLVSCMQSVLEETAHGRHHFILVLTIILITIILPHLLQELQQMYLLGLGSSESANVCFASRCDFWIMSICCEYYLC